MGRIIVIVVAFLILVAGIIGGLYFWGFDPLGKIGIDIGLAKKAPDIHILPPPAPPGVVDFGVLLVPVVINHEVNNQAEIIVRLQIPNDKRMEVVHLLPKLQANFLEDMIVFMPSQVRGNPILDQLPIRRRLLAVCDRTLGPGVVLDVVIEHAVLK